MILLPFTFLGGYLLAYIGIGVFCVGDHASGVVYFVSGTILSIVSFGCIIPYVYPNPFLKIFVLGVLIAPFVVMFSKTESIKESIVDGRYNEVANYVLNNNETVRDSDIYIKIIEEKKTHDIAMLEKYYDNINDYASINSDKLMNLKILNESIQNEEIKSKIKDMLSDGIVTKNEYSKFQESFNIAPINEVKNNIPDTK